MSDAQATFDISLEGNSAEYSDETAEAILRMRDRVLAGEKSIKQMAESLRRLKGSSQDVKDAKSQLSAKINLEREAIGKLTAGAIKAGLPLDALSAKSKEGAGAAGGLGGALEQVGGPVGALRAKLGELGKIMGGGSIATGVFRLAVVGVVAVVAALTVAALGALGALGRFVVEGANAARTADLFREAATGSAENARNLGSQVDALARKVSTSKEELNELAIGLAKNGVQGQTLVDTFNAVAQASDAMGQEAGNKIRGLVEAGRLSQRLFLNRESLVGTGVAFDEVAKQLAQNMKVGVDDARAALAEGRVGIGEGAKALRDTVEKKFGEINARKMLDINVQAAKFRERLKNLTSGVKLEPLLKGVERLAALFDEGTVTGAALKQLVTVFGDKLSSTFDGASKVGAGFFKGMVIGALSLVVVILKMRKAFHETFGDTKLLGDLDALQVAMYAGVAVAGAIGLALATVAAAIVLVGGAVIGPVLAIKNLVEAVEGGWARLKSVSWADVGAAIVDGIVSGIEAGTSRVKEALLGVAATAKGAIKGALGIASPSKVFAAYGENTTEGFAQGVEGSAPAAQAAVDAMAKTPSSGGAGGATGGGARGGPVVLKVDITIQGGGADKSLDSPNVRAAMIQAIREMALSAGLAVA